MLERWRRGLGAAALIATGPLGGCGAGTLDSAAGGVLDVSVRRGSYGVPHVVARDLASAGAGIGYSQAQDAVCILADQFLKVRSERAKYLGPGAADANIRSDLLHLALRVQAVAGDAYDAQATEVRELIAGYASGYNHYLEVTPKEQLPSPCASALWVKPIEPADVLAHHLVLSLLDTAVPLQAQILAARPPNAGAAAGAVGMNPMTLRDRQLGSNGWAIGRGKSSNGRGMLLANPHFPWEGELRFSELHLSVGDDIDVYGASLLGVPVVNIGFNRHIAWTHTMTDARHGTLYRLKLASDEPTSYLYEGKVRPMRAESYSVEVRSDDGAPRVVSQTFWRSHYGPMLSGDGVPWTRSEAYSLRDANEANLRFTEQWLRMDAAKTLDELLVVDREVHGNPWVNTIAADAAGEVLFTDGSRVPVLSEQTLRSYRQSLASSAEARALADLRWILLDGSSAGHEWLEGRSALADAAASPMLRRTDYVMNANDTARYTNAGAPLSDYSLVYGDANAAPHARTRINLSLLNEGGEQGRWDRQAIEHAILGNRSWLAERLRSAVVERCRRGGHIEVSGSAVDLSPACDVLDAWNGRFDSDLAGPALWREFLARYSDWDLGHRGELFADEFDPNHPWQTPSRLTPAPKNGPDPLLQKLGEAVLMLTSAGFQVSTPLGELQRTRKNDAWIPVHGGAGNLEGVANAVGYGWANSTLLPRTEQGEVLSPRTGLSRDGYLVNTGSSFLLVAEFTDAGPRASVLLTYSQSADPASPHFADQTVLFARKAFREVAFDAADIARDPGLVRVDLRIARPSWLDEPVKPGARL